MVFKIVVQNIKKDLAAEMMSMEEKDVFFYDAMDSSLTTILPDSKQ